MNRDLRMAMSGELPTQLLGEPVFSCDTALPCLLRLGMGREGDPEIEAFRHSAALDGNTLPVSRLTELVGKLGVRAECKRLDWSALTNNELSYPILVFLKNTNAVVVTGRDGAAAESVSVWDPLHGDGELLSVRHEDFERAWDGDALVVVRQSSTTAEAGSSGEQSTEIPDATPRPASERAAIGEARLLPASVPVVRPAKSRRLLAIGLAAAAGVGVLLWIYAVTDNFGAAGISTMQQIPNGPRSTLSAAVSATRPDVPETATSAPTGPVPQTASNVAVPEQSEPPGAPAAAAAPLTPAITPEPALAVANPAPAEPTTNRELAATPQAAIPSADTVAAPPAIDAVAIESRLSPDDVAALVARGDVLFSTGDLAAARLFYERAADAGEAQAAVRLGETFDPIFLEQAHLRGVRANVETALSWYRRARDLGAAEAEILMNSLQAK